MGAPSAHRGDLSEATAASKKTDEDAEIEKMLAQLKAWKNTTKSDDFFHYVLLCDHRRDTMKKYYLNMHTSNFCIFAVPDSHLHLKRYKSFFLEKYNDVNDERFARYWPLSGSKETCLKRRKMFQLLVFFKRSFARMCKYQNFVTCVCTHDEDE